MDIKEAYATLEVSSDISDDELKKKYKELARTYHPDLYKGDDNKFKQINAAYQLIIDYKNHPEKYNPKMQGGGFWNNVVDLGEIFFNGGDFFRNVADDADRIPTPKHVEVVMNISFHECILGCTKEIVYDRNLKCSLCQGVGVKKTGNGCDKCDGFGRKTISNKGMIFQTSCDKCFGKNTKKDKCAACSGKKVLNEKRTGKINIPPGSDNNEILRLAGEGNFAGRHMLGDSYTDVMIHIKVEPYKNMLLKDKKNVYSELNISLLEALEGSTKEIETIYGNKEIILKPKSRHSDQIYIPDCGVKDTKGTHIVQLNVEYPNDISELINALKCQSY